ncbi:hypothetical protein [Effusibacillus lacus]|nr:hypothetical protein [Effusibacillus lacus]TCS73626.1 hypothetical protein EDD64_11739 [Effusibacillus lacus]
MEKERGNASLLLLGMSFGIMVCALLAWMYISVQLIHGAAGVAAESAAIAASNTLQEMFAADITPEAYDKLKSLEWRIREDSLYKSGHREAAIIKHTVSSALREELLAGKRGTAIKLHVLLQYEPFFTSRDLGRKILESIEQHWESEILPVTREFLRLHGSFEGEIRFPVHKKMEVLARIEATSPMLNKLAGQRKLFVGGRGHALYIKLLDDHGIVYDLSGIRQFSRRIH